MVLGQALLGLLRVVNGREEVGLDGWSEVIRYAGRLDLNVSGDSGLPRFFSQLAALMDRRKMVLADAEVATLLGGVWTIDGLRSRGMLKLAIKTAQAHPGGETVRQLLALLTSHSHRRASRSRRRVPR